MSHSRRAGWRYTHEFQLLLLRLERHVQIARRLRHLLKVLLQLRDLEVVVRVLVLQIVHLALQRRDLVLERVHARLECVCREVVLGLALLSGREPLLRALCLSESLALLLHGALVGGLHLLQTLAQLVRLHFERVDVVHAVFDVGVALGKRFLRLREVVEGMLAFLPHTLEDRLAFFQLTREIVGVPSLCLSLAPNLNVNVSDEGYAMTTLVRQTAPP